MGIIACSVGSPMRTCERPAGVPLDLGEALLHEHGGLLDVHMREGGRSTGLGRVDAPVG